MSGKTHPFGLWRVLQVFSEFCRVCSQGFGAQSAYYYFSAQLYRTWNHCPPTQAAQQFWFSSWSADNHIRFKYFAQRMLNHPSIIERKNQDIWRYWLHSKAYNSPQWWLDLNSPLSFQFAIEDERVYFLGKESSEPENAFLAGTGLSGQFSRDRDCYSIWKYMSTLCERKSRDIQLLDKRLSSLSRHPGALNDLLATLLMKNTAFKNRAWKRVENYEEDNQTKHHVYVSMESTT